MKNPNRREILIGSLALGAATLTSTTAMARLMPATTPHSDFNCEETHQSFATLLDAIIEAPHIDGEHTAAAMMEAHCPFCKQLVNPTKSMLRAVVA